MSWGNVLICDAVTIPGEWGNVFSNHSHKTRQLSLIPPQPSGSVVVLYGGRLIKLDTKAQKTCLSWRRREARTTGDRAVHKAVESAMVGMVEGRRRR